MRTVSRSPGIRRVAQTLHTRSREPEGQGGGLAFPVSTLPETCQLPTATGDCGENGCSLCFPGPGGLVTRSLPTQPTEQREGAGGLEGDCSYKTSRGTVTLQRGPGEVHLKREGGKEGGREGGRREKVSNPLEVSGKALD